MHANKTILSETSKSGDYSRLEGNKGWKIYPAGKNLTNRICPGEEYLTKTLSREVGFDRF